MKLKIVSAVFSLSLAFFISPALADNVFFYWTGHCGPDNTSKYNPLGYEYNGNGQLSNLNWSAETKDDKVSEQGFFKKRKKEIHLNKPDRSISLKETIMRNDNSEIIFYRIFNGTFDPIRKEAKLYGFETNGTNINQKKRDCDVVITFDANPLDPAKIITAEKPSNNIGQLSASQLCKAALNASGSDWSSYDGDQKSVVEAKKA